MAWIDETLFNMRILITEDWKLEDEDRMKQVGALFVQARLDHAQDCGVEPYSEALKAQFASEFARLLREAQAFESADLLRDQLTQVLFTLPSCATGTAPKQPASSGPERPEAPAKPIPLHLN
ncbi:MAG: hypothetical protein AAF441_06645 [Pseudomonadota bacterium]